MLINDFLANIYLNYFGALSVIMPNLFLASQITVTDEGLRFIGAGLAIIGVLGAGIGQGNAGAGACMAIGRNPEAAGKITTTMVISAGIAESGAIYALLIAILILFAV